MKTIETKIAKNGAVNLYVDGKRASLERTAKEMVNSPAEFKIVGSQHSEPNRILGKLGTFTFNGIVKKLNWYGSPAGVTVYEFTNENGDTVTMERPELLPEFVIYREVIKTVCGIPYGIAKFNPAATVNVEDYAVTVDAQDAAVEAELEQATEAKKIAELKAEYEAANAILQRGNVSEESAKRIREVRDEIGKQIPEIQNAATNAEFDAENFKRARKVIYSYEFEGRRYWKALDCLNEFSRVNKATAIAILKEFGLTVKTFLAEQEKFIAAEISKTNAKILVEEKARHIRDKITRESKPVDDSGEVFNLLPDFADEDDDDELIDEPEQTAGTVAEISEEPEIITIITQSGDNFTVEGKPIVTADGCKLKVNQIEVGEYYTPEDAQTAAYTLQFDIDEFDGDHSVLHKFHQAEVEFEDSPTGGDKVAEHLNANAPEGWTVTRDKGKLFVEYHGKQITEAERVTDRDLLVPQAFFRKFEPLIGETEFGERDTIESFCKSGALDDDGNLWF